MIKIGIGGRSIARKMQQFWFSQFLKSHTLCFYLYIWLLVQQIHYESLFLMLGVKAIIMVAPPIMPITNLKIKMVKVF